MSEEGVITSHYGIAVAVRTQRETDVRIRVRRNSGHVVGDRVRVEGERLTRLERRNVLQRKSPGGGVNTVAANLDVVLAVVAERPPPREGVIDRCAVASTAAGIAAGVVFNKCDLGETELDRLRELYAEELPFFLVSAKSGSGIQAVSDFIADHGRAIFVGHSGVGKSSLVNAIVPSARIEEGLLNETTHRGKHTTTVSSLHELPDGGELVDTPGFREFGLVDVDPQDLASYFIGFADAPACKFRNCLHRGEPGCGIEAHVSPARLQRYRLLLDEQL